MTDKSESLIIMQYISQIVQSRLDRRLQEIEREIKRDKDEQQQQGDVNALINELNIHRKLTTPIHNEEDKILQARLLLAESNKQMVLLFEFI